jgi:hypothetical protein
MFIDIFPDGTVRHLAHDDLAELSASLGPSTTRRASQVERNDLTRRWEVRLDGASPDSAPLYSHPIRSLCLQWEDQQILNLIPHDDARNAAPHP